jgi:hypothetical protein
VPAVWTEIVTVVQTLIQGLSLTYTLPGQSVATLSPQRVYAYRFLTDRGITELSTLGPVIIVAQGATEEFPGGEFGHIDIVYPVVVAHLFAGNQDYLLNDDRNTWRQAILDTFHRQGRPEVTLAAVPDCNTDPNPVMELAAFQGKNLDVGGLLFRFSTIRKPS